MTETAGLFAGHAEIGSQFYDAVSWTEIPHGSMAALYFDGRFAAPPNTPKALSLARHRWITVTGNYRDCSIADLLEQPGYTPGKLRGFVRGRRGLGMDAIIYSDRAQAAEGLAALRDFGHGDLAEYAHLWWWISTLDGIDLDAEELARELRDSWGADIPASSLWGHQWTQLPSIGPAATLDVSRLYGEW